MFRGVIHSHTKFLLITIYTTLKEMAENPTNKKFYDIAKEIEDINVIYNTKYFIAFKETFDKYDEQQRINILKSLVQSSKVIHLTGDESMEDILAKILNQVEFLGHTINDSGSHFSRDGLESGFDTGSFMHSVLGGADRTNNSNHNIGLIGLIVFVVIHLLFYGTQSNTPNVIPSNSNNTALSSIVWRRNQGGPGTSRGRQGRYSGEGPYRRDGGRKRTKKNRKSKRKQARRKSNRRRR